jgi:acyl carrier protein
VKSIDLAAVVEVLDGLVDLSGITPREDSRLGIDIPLSSQDMLRLTSRLEARFGFRFQPVEILGVRTLGDLVRLSAARCATRARPA